MAPSEKNITYGLKFQARAMVPLHSEGAQSRWLVGTNALRDENEVPFTTTPQECCCLASLVYQPAEINTLYLHSQIQVLEYEPEKDTIRMAEVHSHPQEVWQIAPCPSDPRMLMTVHNEGTTYRPSRSQPLTRSGTQCQ